MDGVRLPQSQTHLLYSLLYFLPLSSQKFLVLILLKTEGWKAKADSTLEPPSGFEHKIPGVGIQSLNYYAIVPLDRTNKWMRNS